MDYDSHFSRNSGCITTSRPSFLRAPPLVRSFLIKVSSAKDRVGVDRTLSMICPVHASNGTILAGLRSWHIPGSLKNGPASKLGNLSFPMVYQVFHYVPIPNKSMAVVSPSRSHVNHPSSAGALPNFRATPASRVQFEGEGWVCGRDPLQWNPPVVWRSQPRQDSQRML